MSRLARGALAGAAVAGALLVAEVGTSLVLGAVLPVPAWAFHAAYYVPAFMLAGAAVAAFLPVPVATATLVWVTAFAYCAAAVTQDLLRGQTRWAPARLAAWAICLASVGAAAWITERVLARRRPGPLQAHLVRLMPLPMVVAGVQVGLHLLRGRPPSAALVPPLAAAATVIVAMGALAPLAARLSARAAFAGVAILVLAVTASAAWRAGRPPPGTVRDAAQPPPPSAGADTPPSVVLIVLDAVRASSLSCYGYERRTTPALDAFATGAVRFASAATVSSWSVPTHASLFTGLFPPEHGAGAAQRDTRTGLFRPAALDARFATLAEALAGRGYATAGVSANPLVSASTGLDQGFRFFDARPSPRALAPRYRTLLQRVQGLAPRALLADALLSAFPSAMRSGEEITHAAVSWLARRPRAQPYLLFVNYMDAHTPFVHRAGFSGRWPGRSARLPSSRLAETFDVMAGRRGLTTEESDHLHALYDDALSYLDHHLGRLLAALEAEPDRDRTWIIITADHGEQLGEHGRLGHDCVLYPEVLHVPLIVRYPRGSAGGARHGQTDDRPVQLTDLAPAILGNGALPPAGRTAGGARAMTASVDCFCWREHPRFHGAAAAAVVVDGLHYLDEQGRAPVLLDFADPARAVAADRSGQAPRLAAELERWRAGMKAPVIPPGPGDPERDEALAALGYVK